MACGDILAFRANVMYDALKHLRGTPVCQALGKMNKIEDRRVGIDYEEPASKGDSDDPTLVLRVEYRFTSSRSKAAAPKDSPPKS